MRFVVDITCDNAAFEGNPVPELSLILQQIQHDLSESTGAIVRDSNGNVVGVWSLTEED